MDNFFIVFGSWKIRHDEPLEAGEDVLTLHRLPAVQADLHSLLMDLRGDSHPVARFEKGVLTWYVDEQPSMALRNLTEGEIPLAAVRIHGEESLRITHLLTRLETQITHLLKPPIPSAPCGVDQLLVGLQQSFSANHIYLNNFECFYIKAMPDTELEQKFNIGGNYDYHVLNRQWYAALADGAIDGFLPQLGDEIEHWAYDNDFCQILPNAGQVQGYVSVMHWSRKRKLSWDEPVVTFKKKLYQEDALERWERNYAEQCVANTPEEALADFFSLPLERLPSWRRIRYDIACEAVASGNIFMVNFEDSRVAEDSSTAGRLQQCEIEYLKTRGVPDTESIYRDLSLISQRVESFMGAMGLVAERTNYSKLTFLQDYIRETQWDAAATAASTQEPCV